jgi:hypothetical protein
MICQGTHETLKYVVKFSQTETKSSNMLLVCSSFCYRLSR